jgi:TetR/AcrR family transcriptional regulator, tetracycline repressor protein
MRPGATQLAVFADIRLDEELLAAATWDQCIAHVAEMMFAAMVRHQNVAPLMVEQIPAGPHALRIRERCLTVLLANGFTPLNAVQTYATVARFVLGFAVQLRSESAQGGQQATPLSVGSIPLAEEFDYGLQLMITGLRVHRKQALVRRGAGGRD